MYCLVSVQTWEGLRVKESVIERDESLEKIKFLKEMYLNKHPSAKLEIWQRIEKAENKTVSGL